MIDVPAKDLQIILRILERYLSDEDKVFAFGSRVKGQARKNSDFDLVIDANKTIPLVKLWKIKDEFEESDIPFRIDISDWHTLSDSFKNFIKQDRVIILDKTLLLDS